MLLPLKILYKKQVCQYEKRRRKKQTCCYLSILQYYKRKNLIVIPLAPQQKLLTVASLNLSL
jgi:hypothetical protein